MQTQSHPAAEQRPTQTLFDIVQAQTQPERLCIRLVYKNHRGETSERRILPTRVWFGETEWHPGAQWLLDAIDVEKGELRSFAVKDIAWWTAADGCI
jgi:predicted DNA-binding transcriptional regulator YafY